MDEGIVMERAVPRPCRDCIHYGTMYMWEGHCIDNLYFIDLREGKCPEYKSKYNRWTRFKNWIRGLL